MTNGISVSVWSQTFAERIRPFYKEPEGRNHKAPRLSLLGTTGRNQRIDEKDPRGILWKRADSGRREGRNSWTKGGVILHSSPKLDIRRAIS